MDDPTQMLTERDLEGWIKGVDSTSPIMFARMVVRVLIILLRRIEALERKRR